MSQTLNKSFYCRSCGALNIAYENVVTKCECGRYYEGKLINGNLEIIAHASNPVKSKDEFRIITDGNRYMVQKKLWIFWLIISPSYSSIRGARNFIAAQNCEKIKKWRVVK